MNPRRSSIKSPTYSPGYPRRDRFVTKTIAPPFPYPDRPVVGLQQGEGTLPGNRMRAGAPGDTYDFDKPTLEGSVKPQSQGGVGNDQDALGSS